jgi:hypothetical protein
VSSVETHRAAVCVVNVTTATVRTWWYMHYVRKLAWLVCVCFYLFIGTMLGADSATERVVWDVFFTSAWTAIWVWMPEMASYED